MRSLWIVAVFLSASLCMLLASVTVAAEAQGGNSSATAATAALCTPGAANAAEPSAKAGAESQEAESEKDLSYGMNVGVFSNYTYRAVVVNDRPVLQGDVWVEYKGVKLDSWHNLDLTRDNHERGRVTESDWTLSYEFDPAQFLSMETGFIYYAFPNTPFPETQELYATATLETVPLSPSATVWWDIDESHAVYGTVGVEKDFETTIPCFTPNVYAKVGVGDSSFFRSTSGQSDHGLSDATVGAQFPIKVNDHFSIVPGLAYMQVLKDKITDETGHNHEVTADVVAQFSW